MRISNSQENIQLPLKIPEDIECPRDGVFRMELEYFREEETSTQETTLKADASGDMDSYLRWSIECRNYDPIIEHHSKISSATYISIFEFAA